MGWLFKKGKSRRKPTGAEELDRVTHHLELLAESEKGIADFYTRCAEVMPEESTFWEGLAASEEGHCRNVRQMIERIRQHPEQFRPGETFNTSSIRMFELFVRGLPETRILRTLSYHEIIAKAAEVEESAFEMHYQKMIQTEDGEFRHLADQVENETETHRRLVADKLALYPQEKGEGKKG